jgi:tetratricopeptide (TPR) repeat protein
LDSKVGQIAEYLDGLPTTKNKAIRDLFERGREHERKGEYREAIALFEACLQQGVSRSERIALNILIGNCYAVQSNLNEAGDPMMSL